MKPIIPKRGEPTPDGYQKKRMAVFVPLPKEKVDKRTPTRSAAKSTAKRPINRKVQNK